MIFCQTPEQRREAQAVISEITRAKLWPNLIVTEIADAATFYPAEQYHQQYFERNGGQPYCQVVVAPLLVQPVGLIQENGIREPAPFAAAALG